MNQYSDDYEPLTAEELADLRAELAPNNGKPWSHDDEVTLDTLYPTVGGWECAFVLGRTLNSVTSKARRRGLRRYNPVWSKKKLEWLEQNYRSIGLRGCAVYLDVTPKAVLSAITNYKLKVFPDTVRRMHNWTKREDQLVTRMVELIAEGLDRSTVEVQKRIHTLRRELNTNDFRAAK